MAHTFVECVCPRCGSLEDIRVDYDDAIELLEDINEGHEELIVSQRCGACDKMIITKIGIELKATAAHHVEWSDNTESNFIGIRPPKKPKK